MATLIHRLSAADVTNLAVEASDTPMHQGVLASIDAAPLLDEAGSLRIAEVRAHVEARLDRVPELRWILRPTHLFEGRATWVDDPNFRVDNHVLSARLAPPGGERAALAFAESQMAVLMDRTRPLWQLWLLEGYGQDRIGLLIKVHHALADGPAIVNMLGQVFDIEPRALDRRSEAWSPATPPSAAALVRDNARIKGRSLAGGVRSLAHPVLDARSAAAVLSASREALRQGRHTPRTSLNRPIGTARRLGSVHLSLGEVHAAAHAAAVKVNDVFLGIVAGALRRVLVARGEPVNRTIHVSVAVSRTRFGNAMSGNHAGTVVVPVPLDTVEPHRLLADIAVATERAKARQMVVASRGVMVFLARAGITRTFIRHQHMINVLTTNLPGPPVPLYFAGALVHEPVALPPIAGNVTVSFAALSYAGGLTLSFVADRQAWPDADLLTEGLRSSWLEIRQVLLPATA